MTLTTFETFFEKKEDHCKADRILGHVNKIKKDDT